MAGETSNLLPEIRPNGNSGDSSTGSGLRARAAASLLLSLLWVIGLAPWIGVAIGVLHKHELVNPVALAMLSIGWVGSLIGSLLGADTRRIARARGLNGARLAESAVMLGLFGLVLMTLVGFGMYFLSRPHIS